MSDQSLATASARPTAPPPPASPSPSTPSPSPAPILPQLPPLPSRRLPGSEWSEDGGPPTAPARPVDLPVPVSAGPVSSGTVRAHRAGRRTARVSHQPRPRPQARARTPGRLGRGLTIGAALGLWVTSFVGGAAIGALTRAVDLSPTPHADHPAQASERSPTTTDGPGSAAPVDAGGPTHPAAATPATMVERSGDGNGGHGSDRRPGRGTATGRAQGENNGNSNGHAHGRSAAPAGPTTTTTTSSTTTTSDPTTTTTTSPGDGGNGNANGGDSDDPAVTPLPIERPSTG